MALFVRELKDEEWKELESLAQQPEGDVPEQRLRIVRLSAQGCRVQEVSRAVDLHPINVRKWIHRFNEDGIEGLRSGKSPGRPPVFSAQQREHIVEIASVDPRQLDMNFSQWSLQRLRKYLIQKGIIDQISVETIRQVLRAHGIKHRLTRSWRRDAFVRAGRRPATKLNLRYETPRQLSQRSSGVTQP
jgi:transposase